MNELIGERVSVAFCGDTTQIVFGVIFGIDNNFLIIDTNDKENKFKQVCIPMNRVVSVFVYR